MTDIVDTTPEATDSASVQQPPDDTGAVTDAVDSGAQGPFASDSFRTDQPAESDAPPDLGSDTPVAATDTGVGTPDTDGSVVSTDTAGDPSVPDDRAAPRSDSGKDASEGPTDPTSTDSGDPIEDSGQTFEPANDSGAFLDDTSVTDGVPSDNAASDTAGAEAPSSDTSDSDVGTDEPTDTLVTDTTPTDAPATDTDAPATDTDAPDTDAPATDTPPTDTDADTGGALPSDSPPADPPDTGAIFCALSENPPNEGAIALVSGAGEGLLSFNSDGTHEAAVPGASLPSTWPCIGGSSTETWIADAGLVDEQAAFAHVDTISGFPRTRALLAANGRQPSDIRVRIRPTALAPADWGAMNFGPAMSLERRVFRNVPFEFELDGDTFLRFTLAELVALRSFGSDRCNDGQSTDYLDLSAPAIAMTHAEFSGSTTLTRALADAMRRDAMDSPLKISQLGRIPTANMQPINADGRQGHRWAVSSTAPATISAHPPACWTPH